MSTKEICRSVNGVKDRSFCHFSPKHNKLTEKSWSEKRGCRNLPRSEVPCKFSYKEVWYVLHWLVEKGLIHTFLGKGLDLKKMGLNVVVSSDRYRFYRFVGE